MRTVFQGALIATILLGVAACDSKGTKEVKQEAKAIDQTYKAQADLVEASAKNAPDSNAAEQRADALRSEGAAIKDNLIDEAKQTQHDTRSK